MIKKHTKLSLLSLKTIDWSRLLCRKVDVGMNASLKKSMVIMLLSNFLYY